MQFCGYRHAEIDALLSIVRSHLISPEAERAKALLRAGLPPLRARFPPNASDMKAPGLPPDRAPMFLGYPSLVLVAVVAFTCLTQIPMSVERAG
jgi:hypothetical protein